MLLFDVQVKVVYTYIRMLFDFPSSAGVNHFQTVTLRDAQFLKEATRILDNFRKEGKK